MISIISLTVFLAFYVLYNTSKKATLSSNFQIERWIQHYSKASRFIGIGILAIAYSFLIALKAIGSATLIFIILIMTIGSLVVILAPLKIINYKLILGMLFLAIFFEIYS
ncbi:hypothetical protein EOD40_00915 [Flavobacterium sufflavum]|uniref:DUF3325 domain-containing protein n=1 Tax=Flavobacterium sufflavum TaxID=1921138 RepID=A0A3S2USP8_9FLAO|nr:hypothetical protein [Flavobacterium sufflavum]RVT79702.1 hypothetical protein EOD40_00915 [Flavobacterium sufflavum]